MTLHRNLAFVSGAVLLVTAAWRWRRPFSRAAAVLGVVGAAGLAAVGYLGGELVYRHAVGIPTAVLRQVSDERVGFDEAEMQPGATRPDTLTGSSQDSSRAATKPHAHAPGREHDD
jgi:hypothetical protein